MSVEQNCVYFLVMFIWLVVVFEGENRLFCFVVIVGSVIPSYCSMYLLHSVQ